MFSEATSADIAGIRIPFGLFLLQQPVLEHADVECSSHNKCEKQKGTDFLYGKPSCHVVSHIPPPRSLISDPAGGNDVTNAVQSTLV